MKVNGAETINFNDKVIVFDKLVGGSNDANVAETAYNAAYEGGLLGAADANGNKLYLNFGGLKIQPLRWVIQRNDDYEPILDANRKEQYVLDAYGNRQLEWNTVDSRTFNTETKKYKPMAPVTSPTSTALVISPPGLSRKSIIRLV